MLQGKHLTAGIVDEHSHIAAASINESGQNSSAEVSIEDVIDADDVDIYQKFSWWRHNDSNLAWLRKSDWRALRDYKT